MTTPTAVLLQKLKGQRSASVLPRLRTLLKSPEGRILTNPAFHPTVSVLEPIWRARLQISQADGTRIDGLTELLPRLQSLPPNLPVQQFGVAGAEEAGNIFFDANTGDLLGAVLVTMSEHTRAYLRGDLKGRPFDNQPSARKPSRASSHRATKPKKVMV
jgi:hypothetical protein